MGFLLWLTIYYIFRQRDRGFRSKLVVEVVKPGDRATGFRILPKRWIVDRTFGWHMGPGLIQDYGPTETSAAA